MDYWDNVDHFGDLASIYGFTQRQNLLTKQRELHRTQEESLSVLRETVELQNEQLRKEQQRLQIEQRRAQADEQHRSAQLQHAQNLKRARKLLTQLEQAVGPLRESFGCTGDEIVFLAFIQGHLNQLQQRDIFENLDDTYITRLSHATSDFPVVKQLAGHKTTSMTLRYIHLTAEHKRRAVELIEQEVTPRVTPDSEGVSWHCRL
jgi:integrase